MLDANRALPQCVSWKTSLAGIRSLHTLLLAIPAIPGTMHSGSRHCIACRYSVVTIAADAKASIVASNQTDTVKLDPSGLTHGGKCP
jgi:hypothetical protein